MMILIRMALCTRLLLLAIFIFIFIIAMNMMIIMIAMIMSSRSCHVSYSRSTTACRGSVATNVDSGDLRAKLGGVRG